MVGHLLGPRGLAWLFLAVAIVRTPGFFFGPVDIDETDAVVLARMIGEGAIPYVDFAEKKPFLFYLFYAPAVLFGFSMWPMQILALLWSFATCVVVGRAARRLANSEEAGVAGAWLAALASAGNVISVNAELMLNLPAAGALLFWVRAGRGGGRRDDLFCGLCAGVAALFKHQAGVLLIAILAALAWLWLRGRAAVLARMAAVAAGFAAPWAAVAGLYAAIGHGDAFWEWNVERNFQYSALGAGSALGRFAVGLGLYVVLSAPLSWFFAVRETPRAARDPVGLGVALALWLTWIPVSLGGRFYAHYYLQFVPPLALLAASGAANLGLRWESLGRRARAAVALALALPFLGYLAFTVARGAVGRYPCQEPRTVELARWLRENTAPDTRLFVWGHYTPIYYLARRLPGTRYHNTSVHVGDFDPAHLPRGFDLAPFVSERDVRRTLEDLERNRPAWIIDTAPADIHDWSKVPLEVVPALARYVRERYARVARPGGADVYRRRAAQP